MSASESPRLRIPSSYYVYSDPPNKAGEETLHFVSAQRRVKLRGRSFREFVQRVVPLLDGTRPLDAVKSEVADLFKPEDLDECLALLASNGLLEDVARWELSEPERARLMPQLNLLQMLTPEPWRVQARLGRATVAVVGLSGTGATVAQSMAAAGVGQLRCIDGGPVAPADLSSCGVYVESSLGQPRGEALRDRLGVLAPDSKVAALGEALESDEAVARAVAGSNFVVNCLDEGDISTVYKLNRACLALKIPWTSAASDGLEVLAGPTVFPGETACYLCYRMRAVACAADPEAAFDYQSFLDRRKRDDSGTRPSLVFGAGIAGQIAALEAFKVVSESMAPSLRGRLLVLDLRDLGTTLHVVLRKPWCPACFASWDEEPSP
jgi:adenylyltransferase/sulfurtransferase